MLLASALSNSRATRKNRELARATEIASDDSPDRDATD